MSNFTQISKFFETEYPLNKEGLKELFNSFQVETHKKGELILQIGNFENQLRFLNSGSVREYYVSPEKETNTLFYTKPQFITDFSSFNNDTTTKKNQEALTKIELLTIEKSTFRKLLQKYDCGKSFIDLTFQKILEHKEQFEYNRITKSPEELYKELMAYKPHWLQSIPQYHIASYLGVTPETLSRIRKRI
ncbi:Crp/Fnr family transcriptional regulator [Flammeovirga sp. EKP202]|uniref:Crp/Fnr family transcriptional regulator n=1 Tax=Flammeovirga sp. EKP202 TaxID=2770592 RepID=UPI00165FAF1A|nr:Crp/Fnr family transcriptional regulator [Flammeovirga sp. EKP202]MBD0404131.1 Crp/Fnr family transcriptional regulator [Flammeovirga sp. EKP202]